MPDQKAAEMTELYDKENDVYYVTFKTGEPSYCVEVDDVLVLEVGMFSGLPTGFRILNMARHDTKGVPLEEVKKRLAHVLKNLAGPSRNDREEAVERKLEKVLA
jgi:hypothetical protein